MERGRRAGCVKPGCGAGWRTRVVRRGAVEQRGGPGMHGARPALWSGPQPRSCSAALSTALLHSPVDPPQIPTQIQNPNTQGRGVAAGLGRWSRAVWSRDVEGCGAGLCGAGLWKAVDQGHEQDGGRLWSRHQL